MTTTGTTTRLVLLTGASRGLGRAMAHQLLRQPGLHLLTMARHPDDALAAEAAAAGSRLTQWAVDLADPAPVASRLADWLAAQTATAAPARLDFIHNAALLNPPGPIDGLPATDLAAALRVGLEAPMLLSAAFLRASAPLRAGAGTDCRLLFISSGLGRRAMAGSAPYCAVKGGLDHFARALALDEAAQTGGARVVSLAPGVIDTDMQVQLRGADPARFAEQARFAELHSQGLLDSPAGAAAKVLAWLDRPDFGASVTADVREA